MQKTIRKIKQSDEAVADAEFWRTKTPEERISAVQILREQYISLFHKEREYRESRKGLRRICSVVKRSER
jgi:ribonuclease D